MNNKKNKGMELKPIGEVFWANVYDLLEKEGLTPSDLSLEISNNQNWVAQAKNKKQLPRADRITAIAESLEISFWGELLEDWSEVEVWKQQKETNC
ncbi:hypothetical protein SAMN02745116_01765 [Pilibacter termitis]|uniref:Uncharacterized protein n=1 Tax=Pilibacter termitis TaxID=263852 RepID=A0A1T4PD26_9ENTE|nr:hypothetical protein [Pilibacter termitis]SJZ89460.1 hypothetical protein SAMN02745116_01765 [Pilibacter termitis]